LEKVLLRLMLETSTHLGRGDRESWAYRRLVQIIVSSSGGKNLNSFMYRSPEKEEAFKFND
jgi:hypothetical protein